MKRHQQVLASAAILFSQMAFQGCNKEKMELLPEATQVGTNTLGCKVNSKNWVAQDSDEPFNRTKGVEGGYQYTETFDITRNNVWIRARRSDGSRFQIYLRSVSKPGVYTFGFNTGTAPGVISPYNYGYYDDGSVSYLTSDQHTGTVTITRADTLTGVVSGTFEFKAYNSQTKQTVTITDGRFDARAR